MGRWILYGANGFSGKLIARRAKALGMTPILAARSRAALEALAGELGLESACFDLGDAAAVATQLDGVDLVLHCAGPFTATAVPMLEACLAKKASYLDITGEIEVFDATFARDARAKEAGVALVSGVGCDVVPSDCLANTLAAAVPGAESLELACAFQTRPSIGTVATLIEQFPKGGLVVRDGARRRVAHAASTRMAPFPDRTRFVMSAPWADLVTAHRSTGVPNVTVYFTMPRPFALWTRLTSPIVGIFAWSPLQRMMKWLAGRFLPRSETPREDGWLAWWGDVRGEGGARASATIKIPDPYAFTVDAAIAAVKRVLEGSVPHGAHTPTQAFGAELAPSLPGVTFTWIDRPQKLPAPHASVDAARA